MNSSATPCAVPKSRPQPLRKNNQTRNGSAKKEKVVFIMNSPANVFTEPRDGFSHCLIHGSWIRKAMVRPFQERQSFCGGGATGEAGGLFPRPDPVPVAPSAKDTAGHTAPRPPSAAFFCFVPSSTVVRRFFLVLFNCFV